MLYFEHVYVSDYMSIWQWWYLRQNQVCPTIVDNKREHIAIFFSFGKCVYSSLNVGLEKLSKTDVERESKEWQKKWNCTAKTFTMANHMETYFICVCEFNDAKELQRNRRWKTTLTKSW